MIFWRLFRAITRDTKITTCNDLTVACSNVFIFFYQIVLAKFHVKQGTPTHFNEIKVIWDLLHVKEFVIHHSCFQILRFLVNLPDNNLHLVSIVVRLHMYSLDASCNVTTFTKETQVQEGVNLFWRQIFFACQSFLVSRTCRSFLASPCIIL